MAKSVSSIYDSIENLVPFYPDVAYRQPKDSLPKEKREIEWEKMYDDAMCFSRALNVSYEQIMRWFRHVATNPELHECEGAMGELLSNCEENERIRLMAICRRYSLSIAGETTCFQKTSSLSSMERSDITAKKQVNMAKGEGGDQEVTRVTQIERVKGVLPDQDMSQYWQGYYDFWDDFVRSWFNECKRGQAGTEYRGIAEGYRKCVNDLNFTELPTPYLGTPAKTVQAVIIHLNPGGSAKDKDGFSLDETQSYSNINNGKKGWLIQYFRDEAGVSYRRYIDKWSCLNSSLRGHKPEVCGVGWWQGNDPAVVGGRMKWIKQIYNKDITPESVFALELCPYHSVGFGGLRHGVAYNGVVLPFIKKHVIKPAATAVVEGKLPFALAVGKCVADVLDNVGAALVKEWSYKEPIDGWPRNSGGELTKRTYRRYIVEAHDGQKANIIVTWLKSNRGIPAPGREFDCVERLIRLDCGINNEAMGMGNDMDKCERKHAIIKKRDTTKYSFNGKIRLKQQEMVEAVIRQYLKDNPSSSFEELLKAFPKRLQGTYGCVCKVSDIVAPERFRPEHIVLMDGTEIAICSQWGRAWGTGNIPLFLENARELGYEIEEIPPEKQ